MTVYIHALREEGDGTMYTTQNRGKDFYPRPPRGGRRVYYYCKAVSTAISIHALREEGDIFAA